MFGGAGVAGASDGADRRVDRRRCIYPHEDLLDAFLQTALREVKRVQREGHSDSNSYADHLGECRAADPLTP